MFQSSFTIFQLLSIIRANKNTHKIGYTILTLHDDDWPH